MAWHLLLWQYAPPGPASVKGTQGWYREQNNIDASMLVEFGIHPKRMPHDEGWEINNLQNGGAAPIKHDVGQNFGSRVLGYLNDFLVVAMVIDGIRINPILGKPRVGSAMKSDAYHAFVDIVDNYAGEAAEYQLGNGAVLYQIGGSLNGVSGRFEWIVENGAVTHRMFIPNGSLSGLPIKP